MSRNVAPPAETPEAAPTSSLNRLRALFQSLGERRKELQTELERETDYLTSWIQNIETELAEGVSTLGQELQKRQQVPVGVERRLAELEQENRVFAQRAVELEEHNTNLANLYAAIYQLHSTLDPSAVVQCIVEITINLIGASEFTLFLFDDARSNFMLAAREGEAPPELSNLPAPVYPLEQAAVDEKRTLFAIEKQEGPICCTPLIHEGRIVGHLSIYALLTHKPAFTPLDRELLEVLSAQAALAIVSSQAHVSVDRKLKTVQQVMELLKSQ